VSRFALLLHEEPARPRSIEPSIPEGVEAVIQHAMARETASRIQSVLDLERQLAAFEAPTDATAIPLPVTEHTAQTIALRARLARPAAIFVAVSSCIASGAWLTGVLGALLHPDTRGERTLLAILGVCAVIGVAVLHVRALRAKWQSSFAVSRYIAPFARALLGGVTTFGALELVRLGWFSIAHSDPLNVGIRLVAAGIAAVLGLGWRTWRLYARLGR
jgi:serine/threonine-protein kinase